MLHVASPGEARRMIEDRFGGLRTGTERVLFRRAAGRVLREDVCAGEDVPGFDRSTVDGYALAASDTFGCTDALPALLTLAGEVRMGEAPGLSCAPGQCVEIPTGGQLPAGCDAAAMLEYAEDYGDGTVGILKPVAPGAHVIYRGDDVRAGRIVLRSGKRLQPHDIGALAAMGVGEILVSAPPLAGILSTGDELVEPEDLPGPGQVRDVNAPLLAAAAEAAGCKSKCYGICRDDDILLEKTVSRMAAECDVLFLSGGSSAGAKDAAVRVVDRLGTVHLHGIALKPGKPTLIGEVAGRPVFGLPGHPVAAYFVFCLLARPLLASLQGETQAVLPVWRARLAAAIPSNHGREECVAVRLIQEREGLTALPVMGKSGLITLLSATEGYLRIPRDCEGLTKGAWVEVYPYGDSH